jgi:hypothetical protein
MNRRIACLTLAVLGGSSSVLVFAGCGDDTGTGSNNVMDSGGPDISTTDTGMDAGADQTTLADAANDRTTIDTGSDAGSDSSAESASDAASDADASDAPACVPFDASGLDEASVQAGKLALWTVYNCQGCHQKASQTVDDAGNGLVLSGNNNGLGDSGTVFPPNLTSDPVTGLGCWSDTQVVTAILHGIDNEGKMLCPSMPKWGNALTTLDGGPKAGTPMDAGTAQQIVDFLRSLPVVSNQVPNTTCAMPMQDGGRDAGDAAVDGGDASSNDGEAAEAGEDSGDTGTADAADAAVDAADGATE